MTGTSAARTLVKIGWAALVVVAMVIMTKGLWATVHFEPTAEAIADERRGHVLIAVASVVLVALAAFAYYALSTPLVTPLAMLAAVAVCVAVTLTPAVGVISLLVACPLVLGALVGAASAPRQPGPWLTEKQRAEQRTQPPGDRTEPPG
jgi:hypothetical protein